MTLREQILEKLNAEFKPMVLELVNESHLHGRPPGAETHFKLLIVSDKFQGMSRIDRQRAVNQCFEGARQQGLHALTQKTLTPQEWDEQKDKMDFQSPPCSHRQ